MHPSALDAIDKETELAIVRRAYAKQILAQVRVSDPLHVGAGSGYYSAILAHIVGPGGRVTAIEIDPELAAWATTNLASVPNVSVVSGDAFTVSFDPVDVIYLNAGVSRIPPTWLDGLRDGGRMILPMTNRTEFKSVEPGLPAR